MKHWKVIGCAALLIVMICGCVILGQNADAAKQDETQEAPPQTSPENEPPNTTSQEEAPPREEEQTPTENEPLPSPDTSTSVDKPYSEGLTFRSNGDGTCAVSGIGTCTAASILIPQKSPGGDTVTEILPFAFSGAIVGAIEIPATVTSLSSASFEGCPKLSLLRVEKGSTSFLEYEGMLYSADGRTLLFCPRGKILTELTLHKSVRRIAADAFADCNTLQTVRFAGSSAEWQALVIGDGNDVLRSVTVITDAK
jgi:hypothetical protein